MPEITGTTSIDFEAYCDCGYHMCNLVSSGHTKVRNQPYITITPCPNCLDSAKQESFDDGKEEGYAEGFEAGKAEAEQNLEKSNTETEKTK